MKGCLTESTLQAWLDEELPGEADAAVRMHLAKCNVCAAHAREAEQTLSLVDDAWHAQLPPAIPETRLRARVEESLAQPMRVDRAWWHVAFAHWQAGAAAAMLAIVVTAAIVVRSSRVVPTSTPAPASQETARLVPPDLPVQQTPDLASPAKPVTLNKAARSAPRPQPPSARQVQTRRTAALESETARHLEQMQLLLRSIRNAEVETVSDFAYERELSHELLSRNRMLRRRAERKEGREAEELLNHLEPILLDIANLPDEPAPDDMRSIRELIRDQQIIGDLQVYAGRNLF